LTAVVARHWEVSGAMAANEEQNIFGKVACKVDSFFEKKFYGIGLAVGTRPCTSISLTMLFCVVCLGGISQMQSESRSDKLWIPQGTGAQEDETKYRRHFPPSARMMSVILEAPSGNALSRDFLMSAITLHTEIEGLRTEQGEDLNSLTDLCVFMPGDGHDCFISSVLSTWGYNLDNLAAETGDIATAISAGRSQDDLERMLGDATFDDNGRLTSARAMTLTYFLEGRAVSEGGGYSDDANEAFEEAFLEHMGCAEPVDVDGKSVCAYSSEHFQVFPNCMMAMRNAFGTVIRGDIGLINGAFMIMIVYLILNLGGLCHKIKSRALLAFACLISIVIAAGAGYGLSMWLQFIYTPVHSVLPFVILGIGVDDSFVIINALDRTDPSKPVPERIAQALSHAGASVMVTSLTDFVAFAISVSSALPALSAFCMYAAFSVLFLFLLQITFFAALAAFDAKRVAANKIDCCPCLCARGCPCCATVDAATAETAMLSGGKDPNQLFCAAPKHQGGRAGAFLEGIVAPQLVKPPVGAAVIAGFVIFFVISIWQATQLAVRDSSRLFVPDDHYFMSTLQTNDRYFGTLGTSVYFMTEDGDYFASQEGMTSISSRLADLDFMQSADGNAFESWAEAFKAFRPALPTIDVNRDANGNVAAQADYYATLNSWLAGAGRRYSGDVKWVDTDDPQQGIRASRIMAEFKNFNRVENDLLVLDTERAVEAMDGMREAAASWTGMPSAIVYSREFLTWETFRIIKHEMTMSVSLCLAAVFVITLALIAHPLTSGLVFLCVVMTIVDILGCMNMWGLAIDSVSVIQLVISVGLCVDYAAHIGHSFMKTSGSSRSERVVKTLGDVGSAVLNGGISTFLATMVLAFSKSYVFRVLFQTFFLTVILGLAHGMILLPVMLSLVGPAPYNNNPPEEKMAGAVTKIGNGEEPDENKAIGA